MPRVQKHSFPSLINGSQGTGDNRLSVTDQCPSFLAKHTGLPCSKSQRAGEKPKDIWVNFFCSSNFALKKPKTTNRRCWRQTDQKATFYFSPWNIHSRDTCIADSFAHYKSTSPVLCSSFCSNIQVTKVRKGNTRKRLSALYITVARLCFDTFCWFNI